MSDTIYKPLTPDMRNQINNSIENNIGELNMCKSNIYVNMQKAGYVALKNIKSNDIQRIKVGETVHIGYLCKTTQIKK